MTTPIWPTDLPHCVLREGMTSGPRDGQLRTEMDTGPGKVRLRSSAAIRPFSAEIRVTVNQLARLERFWAEDTAGGVLPFLLADQRFDGRVLTDENDAVLTDENDEAIKVTAWWLVRFAAPYQERWLAPARYMISLQLEILP